jgi:hypothetical protein
VVWCRFTQSLIYPPEPEFRTRRSQRSSEDNIWDARIKWAEDRAASYDHSTVSKNIKESFQSVALRYLGEKKVADFEEKQVSDDYPLPLLSDLELSSASVDGAPRLDVLCRVNAFALPIPGGSDERLGVSEVAPNKQLDTAAQYILNEHLVDTVGERPLMVIPSINNKNLIFMTSPVINLFNKDIETASRAMNTINNIIYAHIGSRFDRIFYSTSWYDIWYWFGSRLIICGVIFLLTAVVYWVLLLRRSFENQYLPSITAASMLCICFYGLRQFTIENVYILLLLIAMVCIWAIYCALALHGNRVMVRQKIICLAGGFSVPAFILLSLSYLMPDDITATSRNVAFLGFHFTRGDEFMLVCCGIAVAFTIAVAQIFLSAWRKISIKPS